MMTVEQFHTAKGLLARLGDARLMIQKVGENISIITSGGSYLPQDIARLAVPTLLAHYYDKVEELEKELLELGVDARKNP